MVTGGLFQAYTRGLFQDNYHKSLPTYAGLLTFQKGCTHRPRSNAHTHHRNEIVIFFFAEITIYRAFPHHLSRGARVVGVALNKGYAFYLTRFQVLLVADSPGALGPVHPIVVIGCPHGRVLEYWPVIQQLTAVVERHVLAVQTTVVVLPA